MPLIVESLLHPTEQDRLDLHNVFHAAPVEFWPPFVDAETLIKTGLANNWLLVGRFNDRLVSAALLSKTEGIWQLSHLCVRTPTRTRGIALRMLQEAQRIAAEHGCELQLFAPQQTPLAAILAQKIGATLSAQAL